ncbi:hypothetical protein [Herbaspirillum huttiense]|uniref:hypothetical protein n=1 Tax=Herbaspirillum huttiense TaxID=863372 RepID=UPI002E75D313|nr:hypothetical protein [Herbaspirillum huttiense]MEE1639125.1 hypothetical protein [Herbaspirillum huttiense NC40101]
MDDAGSGEWSQHFTCSNEGNRMRACSPVEKKSAASSMPESLDEFFDTAQWQKQQNEPNRAKLSHQRTGVHFAVFKILPKLAEK